MSSWRFKDTNTAFAGGVKKADLAVEGGVFVAFDGEASGSIVDTAGLTIMPGFIDVHNHGAVGIDVNEADVDGLLKIAAFLATRGVTAWMPTVVPDSDENYQRVIDAIDELMLAQKGKPVAQAVGVHYEGVFANEKMCGALRPEFFRSGQWEVGGGQRVSSPHVSKGNAANETPNQASETDAYERTTPSAQSGGHPSFVSRGAKETQKPAREQGRNLEGGAERTTPSAQSGGHPSFVSRGASGLPTLKHGVHMTTLAPEIEDGIELIEALVAEGWVVSIGHTRACVETLDRAYAAGARHMTHFFNAMTGVHHRDVGVAGWGLANDGVTFDIIADGIHVHPEMLGVACRSKTPDKVSLISDSVAPTGLGDGEFRLWGESISVVNGRTRNERGSIAGSVISMDDAVRIMLSIGFSDAEVAKMASTNPAKLLGLDTDRGSIEVGKRADLVAIKADGSIAFTMMGGEIVGAE